MAKTIDEQRAVGLAELSQRMNALRLQVPDAVVDDVIRVVRTALRITALAVARDQQERSIEAVAEVVTHAADEIQIVRNTLHPERYESLTKVERQLRDIPKVIRNQPIEGE